MHTDEERRIAADGARMDTDEERRIATDGAQMHTDEETLNGITERIIGAAYKVANELGCGFMEKVYENAMAHELRKQGLHVEQQHRIQVFYDGVVVGDYVADMVVEGLVLVEIKAIKALEEIHSAQCINYLAATGMPICLLINFAKKVEVKRLAGRSAPPLRSVF
ncbi:MAG TPA: GxxExxY protein [Tepidisphaeraceae bacterium]|jgi:GxxExxY protein|nr:GxxExxY protein [Tepidisphaeraceae bacterium]